LARAKARARALGPAIDEALLAATAERLADAWESLEAQEGVSAFFDRRPAAWASGG
jgi:methylglutaconyl-CoA hydratase